MNEKSIYVNQILEMNNHEEVMDFFLVREIEVKEGKNGNYFAMTLEDKTGMIPARKWTIDSGESDKDYIGKIVRVKTQINTYKDTVQLKVEKIRNINEETDKIKETDFIKTAPEKSDDMFNYLIEKAKEIEIKNLKKLLVDLLEANKNDLLSAPAAKTNHHAYKGGLLYHTKRMLEMGLKYLEIYPEMNKDLIISGVILHDFGKLKEFDYLKTGVVNKYTKEGSLLSHILIAITDFENLANKYEISDEIKLLIKHIIFSHHNLPEHGSPIPPAFMEAELVHHLDICDAKLSAMSEQLVNVQSGTMSDRIFALDKRIIYKYEEDQFENNQTDDNKTEE